jgi:PAS domain S-box-containing protein
MRIVPETKLDSLLKAYPFLLDFLAGWSPQFAKLRNPLLRNTVGKLATLEQVAALGEVPLDRLFAAIGGEVRRVKGETVEWGDGLPGPGPAPFADRAAKKEILKDIIRDLHAGGDVEALKSRFATLVHDVSGAEIGAIEQELIDEGLPEAEVRRLCDLHVKVFEDSLGGQPAAPAEPGHPLHALAEENRALGRIVAEARAVMEEFNGDASRAASAKERLAPLVDTLCQIEKHYLKKENQLFPRLEAKGVSGPSKVMWAVHDDIRAHLKDLRRALDLADPALIVRTGQWVLQEISDMIDKEEKVLFPMALEMFDAEDWDRVKKGEEEIGYAWIAPPPAWPPAGPGRPARPAETSAGAISLDTGRLSGEQLDLMLTRLPVDISFVDENDVVVYYSATPERIFPRTPGVIGRKVQNCHPPKSVDVVERILQAFRSGERDEAEFWIDSRGKFIHIRYFAMRDRAGAYRGALEVTQDVTAIRALHGERRLLDWDRAPSDGEV